MIKNILTAFFICLFSIISPGQNPKTKTDVIKTNIYCDHCLDCSDCGGKLVHELSFAKGIKSNKLDVKAMTITVTYNTNQTTLDKIREEISKLGYDADSIKAQPQAYDKLDDCCKKQLQQ